MRYPSVRAKTVLITGCSSGIGRATARVLRDRGWHVVPTARKPQDLEALRSEGFTPVELDVAGSESVQAAAAAAWEILGGTLGGLVNNAGFGQAGALEDVSRDALRYQFEVNVFGAHELTRCFIPLFRKQGWGRIVHIGSAYGLVTAPLVGSYCATKYAMESLADALRLELKRAGIAVSLVEPGPIATAFRRNAASRAEQSLDVAASRFADLYARRITRRKHREKRPTLFTRPPEAVAAKIRHALESSRPRARYRVTLPAHVAALGRRLLPTALIDRLVAGKGLEP